jgi:hypothetical protein
MFRQPNLEKLPIAVCYDDRRMHGLAAPGQFESAILLACRNAEEASGNTSPIPSSNLDDPSWK